MKKILTIGDLHGLRVWRGTKPNNYERVVFIGDYVDAWTKTDNEIKNNLLEIIEFKKANPDKVILLWGNHDVAYLHGVDECSGFRSTMKFDLHNIFIENQKLFQLAYEIHTSNNIYLWNHAGVEQNWFNQNIVMNEINNEYLKNIQVFELAEKLNILFNRNYEPLFWVDQWRGGCHDYGGPLWCGKPNLLENPLKDYIQIVGHTTCKDDIEIYEKVIIVDFPAYPFYIMEIEDQYEEYK